MSAVSSVGGVDFDAVHPRYATFASATIAAFAGAATPTHVDRFAILNIDAANF